MSCSHNDAKVPSAQRGAGPTDGPPVSPAPFGDKSSVIKHFGNIATAAAAAGAVSDGRWAARSPLLLLH